MMLQMKVISSEHLKVLRQQFNYWCGLAGEARKLENNLDFQQGLALSDNDLTRAGRYRKRKRLARKRHNRRFDEAIKVYEEMEGC